jgi:hypothetical protein
MSGLAALGTGAIDLALLARTNRLLIGCSKVIHNLADIGIVDWRAI